MFSERQQELISAGKELRNLEYKASISWHDPNNKEKIVRSTLAMSNVRDGGSIVIGIDEQSGGTFLLKDGMTQLDYDSFKYDNVAAVIAEYADPYATFSLIKDEFQGKKIVIIDVEEFREVPAICKKDGTFLKRGKLYTRSWRIPESVEVPSQTEMREILDIAIEKGIRNFFKRLGKVGISISGISGSPDLDLFEKQLKEFVK